MVLKSEREKQKPLTRIITMEERKLFEIKPFVFSQYFKDASGKVISGTKETLVMVNDWEAMDEFPSIYPIDSIPKSAKKIVASGHFSTCAKRTEMFMLVEDEEHQTYSNVLR